MLYSDIFKTVSGKDVSRVVLGCASVAFREGHPKEALKSLELYIENGGNFLDSARVYGESERILGMWLPNQKREDIFVVTKGAHPPLSDMSHSRITPSEIKKDIETSLNLLKTDYIDLYFLHRDNPDADAGEIMEILHPYVKNGTLKAIGASNWTYDRIEKANCYAKSHGITPFCCSQIEFSLASITDKMHLYPTTVAMTPDEYEKYKQSQMPIMAYSSQANGFFIKNFEQLQKGELLDRMGSSENLRKLEAVRKICKEKGYTPSQVTLGYLLANKVPTFPIIGFKNDAQLLDSLNSATVMITDEELNLLDCNIKQN